MREVEAGTTLLQAIALAGGLDRFAATKRIQLRRTDTSTGQERLYLFNYNAVERGGAIQSMITLREGDVIIVPERQAVDLWNKLLQAGVKPAGLGARDTLRLEAGMNLYGQDMDEGITPWEAGLAWTVVLDDERDFIGRAALEKQKADGVSRLMVGLVMDDKGVLRHGQRVVTAHGDGEILSGTFSPTLGKAIAFARVPAATGGQAQVDIRGKLVPVRVVKYPFVRDGKPAQHI